MPEHAPAPQARPTEQEVAEVLRGLPLHHATDALGDDGTVWVCCARGCEFETSLWRHPHFDRERQYAAALAPLIAREREAAKAEALREFADSRGVNVGDEDSEWWQGYRQAQRECLHDAVARADRVGGDA